MAIWNQEGIIWACLCSDVPVHPVTIETAIRHFQLIPNLKVVAR